jgi:hypothetical protein
MTPNEPETPSLMTRLFRAFGARNTAEAPLSPRLEERMTRMEADRNRRLPGRGYLKS